MQFDAAHIIRRTNERLRHDADAKTRFCHWDDLVSRGGFDGGLKSNALRGENRDVERMGGRARVEPSLICLPCAADRSEPSFVVSPGRERLSYIPGTTGFDDLCADFARLALRC